MTRWESHAECQQCEWAVVAELAEQAKVQKAAEKHTNTAKHATLAGIRPRPEEVARD